MLATATTCCKMSMGPLGVLPAVPAATTTILEEDIDGESPGDAVDTSGSGHHRT
jgi:hypothetical protein